MLNPILLERPAASTTANTPDLGLSTPAADSAIRVSRPSMARDPYLELMARLSSSEACI